MIGETYDDSWDLVEDDTGCHTQNEDTFNLKWEQWANRDWIPWLRANLSFPFEVTRVEDDDDAYFTDVAVREPFRLGRLMEVVDLTEDDLSRFGIIAKVREGRKYGYVPLADLEVTDKADRNYWPVREYSVWMANR